MDTNAGLWLYVPVTGHPGAGSHCIPTQPYKPVASSTLLSSIMMPEYPHIPSGESPPLYTNFGRSPVNVLLAIQDDLVANRLASVIGTTYPIIRFKELKETELWLTDGQQVDLIIADRINGFALATSIRSKPEYQLTPFLLLFRLGDSSTEKSLISSGITDLLVINEENQRLLTKINYYLSLNAQIQSFSETSYLPPVQPFVLPWWKRLLDISVALTILVLLFPVLLAVALLISLDSKGPVIYKSKRAGANFHVFDMYKFRTMRVEADQLLGQLESHNIYSKATDQENNTTSTLCSSCLAKGTSCQQLLFDHSRPICEKRYLEEAKGSAKFMKFKNDPRITRLGTFLRNSSIDELPQLVNILLGDMSLVGNRPLPLYEAEKLTSDEFVKRFAGPAGLTGLWQIKKRGKGEGQMSDRERTLLDIEYSTTFSFKTDVYIIWKTIFSLWQKENV